MNQNRTDDPAGSYAPHPADHEANHPHYGPCDAMAPHERCYECAKMRGEGPSPAATPAPAAAPATGAAGGEAALGYLYDAANSAQAVLNYTPTATPATSLSLTWFADAATPATVLALFAENHQLSQALAAREGDGGIGAMQELTAYFHENGNRSAYTAIRAAAHATGWCIDDGGADAVTPVQPGMYCPLCGHGLTA